MFLTTRKLEAGTKQGADSTFLDDVITRITYAMGKDGEDKIRAVAKSFMISADNAHALHPNHRRNTMLETECI